MLHAQDCYQKALIKGDKLYQKGKYTDAIKAWEKGKSCPDADVAKLDEKIRKIYDQDLDGVPDKEDQCRYEFGTPENKGCPCAKACLHKGISYYFNNDLDSATIQLNLAKACGDVHAIKDLTEWEAIVAEQRLAFDSPEKDAAFIHKEVEQKPEFVGGESQMLKFLYTTIKYPASARENGVEGTVYVRFIVEQDGNLNHITVVRDPGAGLGDEALRVIKTMPAWKPGMIGGKPVRTSFFLPVKYKLM